jgi:hypothetical protein
LCSTVLHAARKDGKDELLEVHEDSQHGRLGLAILRIRRVACDAERGEVDLIP